MQPFFFIWDDKQLKKIHHDDVKYLATNENYTNIVLQDNSFFMVRSTLGNALDKPPADTFIQITRSVAVSINYIDKINNETIIIGDEEINIAKQFYPSLMEKLVIIE